MSSNLYNLSALSGSEIFNDDSTQKTKGGYNRNSCTRSPGSTCFTDLDCSVNSWISNKFKAVSNFNGEINEAEQDFWREDLVCATAQKRYPAGSIYPNPAYAANEKKCCRETDKSFTFYTQRETGSNFKVETAPASGEAVIAGVNTNLNDPQRYSRIHTIYDLLQAPADEYPLLVTPNENSASTVPYPGGINQIRNQYKTLHAHNERMCCTGHWVREFSSGGHKFDGNTGQKIPEGSLRALNWLPNVDVANGEEFFCTLENADTGNCEMRNIVEGSNYEKIWLEWFGKLELAGIPQIFIESFNDQNFKPVDDSQNDPMGIKDPLNGFFNGTPVEDTNIAGEDLFSAASVGTSSSKFDVLTVKKVFSDKDFACCLPTGIQVGDDVTNSACCTGQVTSQNGPRRCCLNDFTDLSVYTNRYVSSEGAQYNGLDITDSDIDQASGFVRKELVKQMGASMCCSGRAEYGVAISELFIPLTGDTINPQLKKRRFIDNSGMDNDPQVNGAFSRFDAGVKWNNHVYCVPSNF
jgi:hypothetical protein